MTSTVELSLSIITYNRRELLQRTIQSIERQTLDPRRFEVLVVDDGSSDDTPRLMEGILNNPTCQIRYLRQEQNRGKSVVRNVSIQNAKGRLLLFLEDDVVADPRLLEEHLKSHENEADHVAVLGREMRTPDSISSPFGKYVAATSRDFFRQIVTWIEEDDPVAFRGFITFNLSLKRSFLLQHGLFDPNFKYFCEDIELGIRLVGKGLQIRHNEAATISNYHPATVVEYAARNLKRGYYEHQLLRKHPNAIPEPNLSGPALNMAKDLFYPTAVRLVDLGDRLLGVPFPTSFYQRIMDYYRQRGFRRSLGEEQKDGYSKR